MRCQTAHNCLTGKKTRFSYNAPSLRKSFRRLGEGDGGVPPEVSDLQSLLGALRQVRSLNAIDLDWVVHG